MAAGFNKDDAQVKSRLRNNLHATRRYCNRKRCPEDIHCRMAAALQLLSVWFPFVPLVHPPSWVPETHMGALPPGKPVWVPVHSVLTLPPSVNGSPACCRFANRTIQNVSSLRPHGHPPLLPLKDEGTVPVTSLPLVPLCLQCEGSTSVFLTVLLRPFHSCPLTPVYTKKSETIKGTFWCLNNRDVQRRGGKTHRTPKRIAHSCNREKVQRKGPKESLTHSFQSGSLEQTAHHCRELELQETKKKKKTEGETIWSPGLSRQGWRQRLPKITATFIH